MANVVELFPNTPFPKEEIKDLIIRLKDGSRRLPGLRLTFSDAKATSTGRITAFMSSENLADLHVRYYIPENGGRGRLLSDMDCLKNLLVETGGLYFCLCSISSLTCCASLIPAALDIFYNAAKLFVNTSMECRGRRELHLSEFYRAMDPNDVAKIVENWKFGPHSTCVFYPQDLSQERKVLGAIFSNRNIECVKVCPLNSSNPIGHGTLGFISSLLSSPVSTVHTLKLNHVSAGTEVDRKLASMLASNKSLTSLWVRFNSGSWVATGMSNVMRETNCTLRDCISIHPTPKEGSLAHTCMKEMQLYVALNTRGRASTRSTTFRPERIPLLLEKAGSTEGASCGRFLYPLLRENPSSWTSQYLGRAERQTLADCRNRPPCHN